jgi:hypothetical protein
MPWVEFEPLISLFERALDREATVIGVISSTLFSAGAGFYGPSLTHTLI